MVTREDKIEQSVSDYVREELEALGYDDTIVQIRQGFPTYEERATELEVSQLAVAFNFDDGGKLVEIGSDLTERIYTIEFWCFGADESVGRNVPNVVRTILESNYGLIPLKDVGVAGQPVIDQLMVEEASVNRQIADDPQPWDSFVWSTTARVSDTYYPSQQ